MPRVLVKLIVDTIHQRLPDRFFFFQAEDGIRDYKVTGVQTCALPICEGTGAHPGRRAHRQSRRGQRARSHAADDGAAWQRTCHRRRRHPQSRSEQVRRPRPAHRPRSDRPAAAQPRRVMRRLRVKMWRDLWHMRWRTLAIVLTTASGVAIYAGIYTGLLSLFWTRDSIFKELRFA